MIEMTAHSGCQCPPCAQEPVGPAVHHDGCPPCDEFRQSVFDELARLDKKEQL